MADPMPPHRRTLDVAVEQARAPGHPRKGQAHVDHHATAKVRHELAFHTSFTPLLRRLLLRRLLLLLVDPRPRRRGPRLRQEQVVCERCEHPAVRRVGLDAIGHRAAQEGLQRRRELRSRIKGWCAGARVRCTVGEEACACRGGRIAWSGMGPSEEPIKVHLPRRAAAVAARVEQPKRALLGRVPGASLLHLGGDELVESQACLHPRAQSPLRGLPRLRDEPVAVCRWQVPERRSSAPLPRAAQCLERADVLQAQRGVLARHDDARVCALARPRCVRKHPSRGLLRMVRKRGEVCAEHTRTCSTCERERRAGMTLSHTDSLSRTHTHMKRGDRADSARARTYSNALRR